MKTLCTPETEPETERKKKNVQRKEQRDRYIQWKEQRDRYVQECRENNLRLAEKYPQLREENYLGLITDIPAESKKQIHYNQIPAKSGGVPTNKDTFNFHAIVHEPIHEAEDANQRKVFQLEESDCLKLVAELRQYPTFPLAIAEQEIMSGYECAMNNGMGTFKIKISELLQDCVLYVHAPGTKIKGIYCCHMEVRTKILLWKIEGQGSKQSLEKFAQSLHWLKVPQNKDNSDPHPWTNEVSRKTKSHDCSTQGERPDKRVKTDENLSLIPIRIPISQQTNFMSPPINQQGKLNQNIYQKYFKSSLNQQHLIV